MMTSMNILLPLDGFLVTNPSNIRYLTGFVGVDKRDAWLLLVGGKKYLFVGPLYFEQAKKLSNCQIIQSTNYPMEIKKLGIKKLGFEESDLTVAEYNKLKDFQLIPTNNRIEKMRLIKRKDEIEHIRLAATITDQCFKYITGRVRPGVTEARLAWEIEGFLRMKTADVAFAPIVAFNEHSSQPHYSGVAATIFPCAGDRLSLLTSARGSMAIART